MRWQLREAHGHRAVVSNDLIYQRNRDKAHGVIEISLNFWEIYYQELTTK